MKLTRLLSAIAVCFALLVLSVGGVSATWLYAGDPVADAGHKLSLNVGDFLWEGSGDLPTDSEVGENHVSLIDNIINHTSHGLNASGSYLNQQISSRKRGSWTGGSRDTLGSMGANQDEELEDIFGLAASELSFLIHFIDDNTYHLYTTSVYLGEPGACNWLGQTTKAGQPTVPIGENIYPIYKTVVKKSGDSWTAVSTEEGYAKSAWYEESRSSKHATQIPSFDPDTFVAGKL